MNSSFQEIKLLFYLSSIFEIVNQNIKTGQFWNIETTPRTYSEITTGQIIAESRKYEGAGWIAGLVPYATNIYSIIHCMSS